MAENPNFQEDTDAYPMLIAVLEAVEEELADTSESVGYASIQVGPTPVIEHAGMPGGKVCGELIVSYVLHYPLGNDLEPQAAPGCGFVGGHDIIVGVYRCAPEVKRTTNGYIPPTAAQYLNSTRQVLADKEAVKRALCKALKGRDYLLRNWEASGEEGNAVGGVWSVTVGPTR